jgi:hypothetical protein
MFNKLFAKKEVVTEGDLAELAALETTVEKLRTARARAQADLVTASGRLEALRAAAEELARDCSNAALYEKVLRISAMPSNPATGWQHAEVVLTVLDAAIRERLQPAAEIVRRCLRRALSKVEAELAAAEKRERNEATAEGYNFSASGRILALQEKVLDLRNQVAARYQFEGALSDPGSWQERLAAWV